MKKTLTGQKLRNLRERRHAKVLFGEDANERVVDHDHKGITGTAKRFVPRRVFFLGEIWWGDREVLSLRLAYNQYADWPAERSPGFLLGLVTRRQNAKGEPVEMAPGTTHPPPGIDELCFEPIDPPAKLRKGTLFVLSHLRPVARDNIGKRLAVLGQPDQQRLAANLAALRSQKIP
jgi:hypothetical protein